MSQGEIKSNDPVLLKQTIIYLRSELNKYKNKIDSTSSSLLDELITENERLTNKYRESLHQNKKYEKRLHLYEQRIRSLETQRNESRSALERLQGTEQDLRAANKQLHDCLASLGNDQKSETTKSIERLETKVDSYFLRIDPSEKNHTKLQHELETARQMNAKQSELIIILEDYIQQLKDEVDAYKDLTEYLIQKTNDLPSE